MDLVYGWVKSIVFFLVLITIINNLIGGSDYKKYIDLITGMILIILVISPLTNLFNINEKIDYYFTKNSFLADTDHINNELIKIEKSQMSYILDEYKREIKDQTSNLLEKKGLYISESYIEINEDERSGTFGRIEGLDLILTYKVEDKIKLSEPIEPIKKVDLDKIQIGEEGKSERLVKEESSQKEIDIKKLLSDFYNIELDNINISIQE